MDYNYLVIPFFAWLVAGACKFLVNSIRAGRMAFDQIGYGGMPSNHSAMVSATTALIAMEEGIGHPAFAVALCLSFIVMLDANSLRGQIGRQAALINKLSGSGEQVLRERIGHTRAQIAAGMVVGVLSAWVVHVLL